MEENLKEDILDVPNKSLSDVNSTKINENDNVENPDDDDDDDDDDDISDDDENDDEFEIPEDETSYVFEIGTTFPRIPVIPSRLGPLREMTEIGPAGSLPLEIPDLSSSLAVERDSDIKQSDFGRRITESLPDVADIRPHSSSVLFNNGSCCENSQNPVEDILHPHECNFVRNTCEDSSGSANRREEVTNAICSSESEPNNTFNSNTSLKSEMPQDVSISSCESDALKLTSLASQSCEVVKNIARPSDVVLSQCLTSALDDDASPTSTNGDSTSDSVCTQIQVPPARSAPGTSTELLSRFESPDDDDHAACAGTNVFTQDEYLATSENVTPLNIQNKLSHEAVETNNEEEECSEHDHLLNSPTRMKDFDDVPEVEQNKEDWGVNDNNLEIDIEALSRMRICMKSLPRRQQIDGDESPDAVGLLENDSSSRPQSGSVLENAILNWQDCAVNAGEDAQESVKVCAEVNVGHGDVNIFNDEDDEESESENSGTSCGEGVLHIPHASSETEVKRALPPDDGTGVLRGEELGCGLPLSTTNHVVESNHTAPDGVTVCSDVGEVVVPVVDGSCRFSVDGVGYCPPGLEALLDASQLVVHMGNLRHDIFFNVRCDKRMEVINEMRRLLYYVEKEPVAAGDNSSSFLFKLYDRNKQEVAQIYNPASRSCLLCGLTWHWFKICHMQAVVYSPLGVIAGFVRRVHTLLVQEFHILAPNETVLLRLRGSLTDLEIYSVDLEHSLGRLSVHGWVGVMHEVRRTPRDYGLTCVLLYDAVPLDLDVHVKGLLLASIFVIKGKGLWFYVSFSFWDSVNGQGPGLIPEPIF